MDPNETPVRVIDAIQSLTFPNLMDRGSQKGTENAEGIR
jgi:hypothetical protein